MALKYIAEITYKFEVKEGIVGVDTHTRTFTDWDCDWPRLHERVRDYIAKSFPNGELKCAHQLNHASYTVDTEY
jgi:hypothetical protein